MRSIGQLVAWAATAMLVAPSAAQAANISYSPELRAIIVDGSIEAGDFEHIREAFDAAGGEVDGSTSTAPAATS